MTANAKDMALNDLLVLSDNYESTGLTMEQVQQVFGKLGKTTIPQDRLDPSSWHSEAAEWGTQSTDQ